MSVFPFLFLLILSQRKVEDDSFIKHVTEDTYQDAIDKDKNAFILFHSDHQRISDTGYLKFVDAAREYKDKANFYVVPGSRGDKIFRLFGISGFPSLYYISNVTSYYDMNGPFSYGNIRRFIMNFTKKSYSDISIDKSDTKSSVLKKLMIDDYDFSPKLVILADNSTKFGRVALQFANAVGSDYKFYRITEKFVGELFSVRFPSILYYRPTDGLIRTYTGEPNVVHMQNWISDVSQETFGPLVSLPFDKDGLMTKSIILFTSRRNFADIIPAVAFQSKQYQSIKYFYADPIENTALLSLLQINDAKRICTMNNYTHISYSECESEDEVQNFSQDKLTMKTTKLHSDFYNSVAKVSSKGFNSFIQSGPLFCVFTIGNTPASQDFSFAGYLAAVDTKKYGSKSTWVEWNVFKDPPPFRKQFDLKIPSIVYFNSTDYSKANTFPEKHPDKLAIIDWAHKLVNDFDIDKLYQAEQDIDQYDSL